MNRKFVALAAFGAAGLLFAIDGVGNTVSPPVKPERGSVASTPLISGYAERVFYNNEGARAWGTFCKWRGGYVTAWHVAENGVPVIGPKNAITASLRATDFAFTDGLENESPESVPELTAGMRVTIPGFPARDRDGEVVPGVGYTADTTPPGWWIELHDAIDGIDAEAVIGGISGSCVVNDAGEVVAVTVANGFSQIEGTTNTWARVIPIRAALLEIQGKVAYKGLSIPSDVPVPDINNDRWGLR